MNYKVKKGDTLSKIAQAQNMSLSELMEINGISKEQADNLQIGQSLKIKSQPTLQLKNYLTSSTAIFPRTVWPNTPPATKTPIPYKDISAEQQYLKDNAKAIQEQLIQNNYNIGASGVDGKWGKASQAALDKAKADGYRLVKGKLVKPESPKSPTKNDSKSLRYKNVQEQLIKAGYNLGSSGADGIWGKRSQTALEQAQKDGYQIVDGKLVEPATSLKETTQTLIRKTTPRAYTAAQNTVGDLIGAPIKRLVGKAINPEFANKVFPTTVYDERHVSSELYDWLQDAVDKKWSPEDRKKYFEKNPNAEIRKGWVGRLGKNTLGQSDYQRYYGEAYTGPAVKGFGATMFGKGLDQAQGTLGSFNIVYTKDGAYVEDSWDFGTGAKFNTDSLMGIIRQAAEDYGSQEKSDIKPTRAIKAKIKYRS